MHKNIIFDLGGVIVEWKPRDFLMERFMDAEIEQRIFDITFGSEEWQLLDRGTITRNEANQRMLAHAKEQDCLFEVEEVIESWTNILRPRNRTIELASFLKRSGYDIYYLSNIAQDAFELLEERGVLPNFNGGVASFEVHSNKPEPEIYKALLSKYNLKADECLFIDDMAKNIQAASELGIAGIRMGKSVNTLIRNLRGQSVHFN